MLAEVIAIGDELTSGQRLDTNSQWISLRLGEMGIRVGFHTTVADDLESNRDAFQQAARRAQLVICTGGLGPTADDLTRQAIAAAAGVELVSDEQALQHIRRLFAKRKREMPPRNEIQAMFPVGSRVIPNPHGTAPGIDFDWPHSDARVFALPGVPAEMREMWFDSVAPALIEQFGQRFMRHRVIKCFGIGESDLEQKLPDLIQRGREPAVGITVHKATITLRITATGATETECQQLMEPTIGIIHDCLGKLVFGDEEDELQDALIRLLRARGETLRVVEAGTGGLLCDWLAIADPDGEVFVGGEVDRSMTADPQRLEQRLQAALQQGAHHAIAVGPFPDPPGRLFLGVASARGVTVDSVLFAGHPDILRERAGKQALDRLRLDLIEA